MKSGTLYACCTIFRTFDWGGSSKNDSIFDLSRRISPNATSILVMKFPSGTFCSFWNQKALTCRLLHLLCVVSARPKTCLIAPITGLHKVTALFQLFPVRWDMLATAENHDNMGYCRKLERLTGCHCLQVLKRWDRQLLSMDSLLNGHFYLTWEGYRYSEEPSDGVTFSRRLSF